jgi:hypothetical protein
MLDYRQNRDFVFAGTINTKRPCKLRECFVGRTPQILFVWDCRDLKRPGIGEFEGPDDEELE